MGLVAGHPGIISGLDLPQVEDKAADNDGWYAGKVMYEVDVIIAGKRKESDTLKKGSTAPNATRVP